MHRPDWEAGSVWKAKRIKDHRFVGSERQYKVEWAGSDQHGNPWADSWQCECDVGDYHVNMYTRRLLCVESKLVSVNLQPVVYAVRKSVAHAVVLAKTKCKPRVHFVPIEVLSLEALGMAFLEMVQHPGMLNLSKKKSARTLPIQMTKGSDGFTMYSVTYSNMEDISAFTQFEHFLSPNAGKGALRYNVGRKSNQDLMVVGMPLEFSFTRSKSVKGMGSFVISFPTAHINGKFGTLQPPPFSNKSKAPLKDQKFKELLADYCKETIPDTHELVRKGWRELPRSRTSLPAHVAVPSK